MTVRIITEKELRDALDGNYVANVDREEALEELEHLRDFIHKAAPLIPVDIEKDPFFDPQYALELLDTVKKNIESGWPVAIDRDELLKGA